MAIDLALQRMVAQQGAEPLHDERREVSLQVGGQVRAVGEVARQQRAIHAPFRVGQQHGELGTGHALAGGAPLAHLLGRREELHVALELALGLQLLHQVLVGLHALHGDLVLLREDLRLQVVVVQDVLHDVG